MKRTFAFNEGVPLILKVCLKNIFTEIFTVTDVLIQNGNFYARISLTVFVALDDRLKLKNVTQKLKKEFIQEAGLPQA